MDDDDDDDFWTTWIATTPELDRRYRGCGLWLLLIVGLAIIGLVLLAQ
jgi:hypothetical protein